MTISRPALVLTILGAMLAGTWFSTHGPTLAQDEPAPKSAASRNIADLMLQPIRLPFAEETSLEDVVAYLRKQLKANVVLDPAALDAEGLDPSTKVQLDVDGVRLKTGLKLLLDQVNLTVKVVPEDNLLIITDKAEAEEPIERVLGELKTLHRDIHTLQDDVRDIRSMLELPIEEEPSARMRNPTIIEEKPADAEKAKPTGPDARGREKPSRARPGL